VPPGVLVCVFVFVYMCAEVLFDPPFGFHYFLPKENFPVRVEQVKKVPVVRHPNH
jgi:hypothetical protein